MGAYKTSRVFSKLPGSLSQYFLLNSAKFILNSADISFESVVESSWPFSTAENMLINSGEYISMFSASPSFGSSFIFPDETTFTGEPPLRLPHDRRLPKKSLSDSEHREIYFDASLSENLNCPFLTAITFRFLSKYSIIRVDNSCASLGRASKSEFARIF